MSMTWMCRNHSIKLRQCGVGFLLKRPIYCGFHLLRASTRFSIFSNKCVVTYRTSKIFDVTQAEQFFFLTKGCPYTASLDENHLRAISFR